MNETTQYSLKELRARKNETQSEVAEHIGVTPQTYCSWEKDISCVSVGKVNALSKHFGVRLDQIKIE